MIATQFARDDPGSTRASFPVSIRISVRMRMHAPGRGKRMQSGFRSRTRVTTRGQPTREPQWRIQRGDADAGGPGQDHRLVLGVGIEVGDIAGGEATERILVGAALGSG